MIKPLKLGNKSFPVNIIQGPLAGVSCAPFRFLAWQYSQPAFSYTEMISCKTILHQPNSDVARYTYKHPAEGPVCFQLSGSNPEELAQATKKVTDLGADLVDLNCGCPVKKIRRKGAGSSLLTDTPTLYKLIHAMKQNTHIPVSVKIRVQGNSSEQFNGEVARVLQEAGADSVTVHGRHWTEHYETPCRYEDIQFFVQQLKVPVIGNGDISNYEQLTKMFATGCAGVMLARATVGQPWLIAKLIAESQSREFLNPTPQEVAKMFVNHILDLADLLDNEKFAVLQARKLAKYYARQIPGKKEFITLANTCETLAQFTSLCEQFFIS